MKKKRLYILLAIVVGLMMWGYCGTDQAPQDRRPGVDLMNRPWVSSLPQSPREPIHALMLVDEEKMGVVVNGSTYQHLVTLLRHQVRGDTVALEVLQAKKRFKLTYRTYKCDAPGELDLCLDIGPKVRRLTLYSSSKWRRGVAGTPDILRGARLPVAATCDGCTDAPSSDFSALLE